MSLVTNGVKFSMVEFSGSHQVPHQSLSSFLELSDISALCHVNKYFKLCFTETGNFLACRLHKLALSVLLSTEKIGSLSRRNTHNDDEHAVDLCHNGALKKISNRNKPRVSPLGLYKFLIKNTKYEPFYEHFSVLDASKPFSLDTNKTLIRWNNQTFFSLYSQLRQAKVYMPTSHALVIRHVQEKPHGLSYISSDERCAKICEESVGAWRDDSSKEELLEFSISLAEQIFSTERRGGCQAWLAKLCVDEGKIEIAQNLLGNINGCDHYRNFIDAVRLLIKHAMNLDQNQRNRIVANSVGYSKTVLGYLERQLKHGKVYLPSHHEHVKEGNVLSEELAYVIDDLLRFNYVKEAASFARLNFGEKEERDRRIGKCSRALATNNDWLEAFKLTVELSDDTSLEYCWEALLYDFMQSSAAKNESLGIEIVNLVIEERLKEKRSRILNRISFKLYQLLKILPVSFCLEFGGSSKCKNLGDPDLNFWVERLKTETQPKQPVELTSNFTPLTSQSSTKTPPMSTLSTPATSRVEETPACAPLSKKEDSVSTPVVSTVEEMPATTLGKAKPQGAPTLVEETLTPVETPQSLPANKPEANPTPTSQGDPPSGGVIYYLRAFCAAIVQGFIDFFAWIRRLCSRS